MAERLWGFRVEEGGFKEESFIDIRFGVVILIILTLIEKVVGKAGGLFGGVSLFGLIR